MYEPKQLYWDNNMKTGDDSIDFQHKYLFESFNKLGAAIWNQQGSESIDSILERLRFYAQWHFQKEEKCMTEHQCPIAEKNQNAHAVFMNMLETYYAEYQQAGGSEELAAKIHESLSDWFFNHVQRIDTGLYACIHARRVTT